LNLFKNIYFKTSKIFERVESWCYENKNSILYTCNLIPNKIKYYDEIYNIIEIPDKYIIYKYLVILNKERQLIKIKLFNDHPNSDYENIYCLTDYIKNQYWDNNIKDFIERSLMFYNLDSCYFNPMCELKLEKIV
jgi:hypothetical protein